MHLGKKRRIGTGIAVSYLLALSLVLAIGALAIAQLQQIRTIVERVTGELAARRALGEELVLRAQDARFYAHQYIRTENQADADRFYQAHQLLSEILALAQGSAANAQERATLAAIESAVAAYGKVFDQARQLIIQREKLRAEVLDVREREIENELTALRMHIVLSGASGAFLAFDNAQDAFLQMRIYIARYLETGDERYAVQFRLSYEEAQEAFAALEGILGDPTQQQNTAQAGRAVDAYYAGISALRADHAQLQDLVQRMHQVLESEIGDAVAEMADGIELEFETQNEQSRRLIAQAQIVLVVTTSIAGAAGAMLSVALYRQSRDRARSAEVLRQSEERYRTLVERVPVGLYRSAPDGQLLDGNPALVHMLGYRHLADMLAVKAVEFYVDPDDRQRWSVLMAEQGLAQGFEARYRRQDGSVIWTRDNARAVCDAEGQVLYYEGSLEDITERKEAEEALQEAQAQLVRREKLAVLGQMAGSVGHDLRNPLGVIKNVAYMLRLMLAGEVDNASLLESIDILDQEVNTAERIITSLLGFARTREPVRREIDVNEVLKQALSHAAIPDHIELECELAHLPAIQADPDQLVQVYENLIVNGVQAMPEGGRLTVGSGMVHREEGKAYLSVSISDTGIGISPEGKKKLFEPLYTTKAKGIGLGLALVRSLVEGHRGKVGVESDLGKGSTFTVELPLDHAEQVGELGSVHVVSKGGEA